jgi:dienelactone hydrolase
VTGPAGRGAPGPSLTVLAADGDTTAVTVVLPGGKAESFDAGSPAHLTAVRMRPFASMLHRHGRQRGLAVWTVHYRFRGWNGDHRAPVADVQWALEEVRRRHGDVPVVLVGHSMGGRAALIAGGERSVRGVCALAPWTVDRDSVDQLAGATVLIAHGSLDVVTSPRASREYAQRCAQVATDVGYVVVRGDVHAMLFRPRRWHRLATGFSLGALGLAPMPAAIERAFAASV